MRNWFCCSSRPNYDNGQCEICQKSHVIKSKLKCGHVFCFVCLVKWSRTSRICPTCREPFTKFRHQDIGSETGKYEKKYYVPNGVRISSKDDCSERLFLGCFDCCTQSLVLLLIYTCMALLSPQH